MHTIVYLLTYLSLLFFFSSRRRHTRWPRDWSSDVCSSDLDMLIALIFTNSESQPLTVAIQSQLRQFGANIDVLSSGAFFSMLVPLFVFFAFQRYFVHALLAGSQKYAGRDRESGGSATRCLT